MPEAMNSAITGSAAPGACLRWVRRTPFDSWAEDRPGTAAELVQNLADSGINLRVFSASVLGTQFNAYIAFNSPEDANRAIQLLDKEGSIISGSN